MSTRRIVLSSALGLCAAAGLSLGLSLPAIAASPVDANKAVVKQYLGAMGTADFAKVAKDLQAKDFKLLRHEFENLKYNAVDPVISKAMQPNEVAIANRSNEINKIIAQNDMVAARLRIKGTHKGNFYGIPATGKDINIEAAAVFKLKDGKIVESWMMAEEAGILRQLQARLPTRQDGKVVLPPVYNDTRAFDDALKEHLAKPLDTPEWRHAKLLLQYKSQPENRGADYTFTGRPYSNLVRGGIDQIVARAAELKVQGSHGASMVNGGRRDTIANVIAEGNQAMFNFRLNAKNTGPLYGVPASNNMFHDWEIGFADFEGDKWTNAWYMADELGMLLTIGNKEAVDFLAGP